MPRGFSKKLQKDWRDTLQEGDVLYEGGDPRRPRVVRRATYHEKKGGFLSGVAFTIKHCSWTGRCYTCVGRADLKQRGFIKAGVRVKIDTPMDAIILNQIEDHKLPKNQRLTCCDVSGIL